MIGRKKQLTKAKDATKSGYTLIEVMLVLGIAGLMLLGMIGGSYTAIARQRYNDSVRGIAEFLKSVYDEALSPASFGGDEHTGNDNNQAILGKVVEFNENGRLYTATIVGNASIKRNSNLGFIEEFTEQDYASDSTATNAALYCGVTGETKSSVQEYTPLWEADLLPSRNFLTIMQGMQKYTYTNSEEGRLVGTLVIARTPTSSTIHTMFAPNRVYNIEADCNSASAHFADDLEDQHDHLELAAARTFVMDAVGICVKSENSKLRREVRIAADGRNSSAVWTLNVDTQEDEQCN